MIRIDLHSALGVELGPLKEFGSSDTRLFYNNDITIKCKDGSKLTLSIFYDEKPISFGEGMIVKITEDA